jgi:osmotically-inducible protein OsmY
VIRFLFALVVAVGLCHAASVPTNGTVAPKAVSAPARRGLSDAQIERNIRERFARSKMTLNGKERFTVSVKDGVATLDGKTGVIQHKGVATRIAKLGGANAVQNHIQVSEEAKAQAAARLGRSRVTGTAGPTRAKVVQTIP